MSSSALTSYCRWPRYGPVPLGRCPDCPQTAPLKRLVTVNDEKGNVGREFVKCESKPEAGKDLAKCKHFEWLDEYINRIELEGASLGVNLPSPVEQLGSATVVAPVGGKADGVAAEVMELKKMNKHLTKLVKLKKQDNVMSAVFYLCSIALGVVYLLIISH